MSTLAALLVRDAVATACAVTGILAVTATSVLFPIAVHVRTEDLWPRTRTTLLALCVATLI